MDQISLNFGKIVPYIIPQVCNCVATFLYDIIDNIADFTDSSTDNSPNMDWNT